MSPVFSKRIVRIDIPNDARWQISVLQEAFGENTNRALTLKALTKNRMRERDHFPDQKYSTYGSPSASHKTLDPLESQAYLIIQTNKIIIKNNNEWRDGKEPGSVGPFQGQYEFAQRLLEPER